RLMNEEFAKAGKFYRDSLDIRLTAEKIAGGSFEEFFGRYVAHANPLPYSESLAVAGLILRKTEQHRASVGFAVERIPDGSLAIRSLDADSNAAAAGLQAGDMIRLLNKQEPPRRMDRWLRERKPGERVQLSVKRGEKQLEIEFRLGEAKEVFYQVTENPNAD